MAFEIIMPKLGVDMQEGRNHQWKKWGVMWLAGDILLEIMSDKVWNLRSRRFWVFFEDYRQAGETIAKLLSYWL